MNYRILLIILITIIPIKGFSCSAFSYTKNGQLILAANTDACTKVNGHIIVNKRNISKKSDWPNIHGEYTNWISKYGSISFTYCCREYSQYGINEKGLTVSTVGLPNSKGPEIDERPGLSGNFWIQYLLDNCSTIQEVMAVEKEVRIINTQDQYLICDSNGKSLVVQCQDGKMIYYFDEKLPVQVLTNEKYAICLANYKKGIIPENDPYISNKRFQIGNNMLLDPTIDDNKKIDFSFNVLDKMSQHPCTRWNIVFDITNRTVYYRTKDAQKIKYFKLEDFDFSCDTKMMMLDVNQNHSGNVKQFFHEYSKEKDFNLMKEAFANLGINKTEDQLKKLIDYFDDFKCVK